MLSSGLFPGFWFLCADVSEHSVCSIFIGRWLCEEWIRFRNVGVLYEKGFDSKLALPSGRWVTGLGRGQSTETGFSRIRYKRWKSFFRSVNNDGHFTWTTKYFFFCISGNSLVRYDYHIPRICYKHCEFGGDHSILTFTLLREQSTSSSVSRLLLKEIPWFFALFILRACVANTESLVAISQ